MSEKLQKTAEAIRAGVHVNLDTLKELVLELADVKPLTGATMPSPPVLDEDGERNRLDAIHAAYNTWPVDLRAKLSLHDLRRMSGWVPRRDEMVSIAGAISQWALCMSYNESYFGEPVGWLKRQAMQLSRLVPVAPLPYIPTRDPDETNGVTVDQLADAP